MKLLYGCSRDQRNFLQAVKDQMGFRDSRLCFSYHSFPLDLSQVSAVVLAGNVKLFFENPPNLNRFIYDSVRDNVSLIYLGRYRDHPGRAMARNAIWVNASNRTSRRICRDIYEGLGI